MKSENEEAGIRKRGKKKRLVRKIKVRVDNIMYGKRRQISTNFYERHEGEKLL